MFGLNVVRCKPHLICCCGRDPAQEEGVGMQQPCVGQGSILADPTRLTHNAIDIRQRYPNCFLRAHTLPLPLPSRYPDFDIFTHISHFTGLPLLLGLSWQDSRSFYRLEICFADARQRVTFSVKYFYASYFIAAGLEYANNSSAIIVWMCKNLRNIT